MKNRRTFDEIRKYLIRDQYVRSQIIRKYGGDTQTILEALTKADEPYVFDTETFLIDLLHNEARLYKRFTAKGSYGNYSIDIRGLGGVYYYWAPEFGSTGYFLSINEASDAIVGNWSDSLISSSGRLYRKPFIDDSLTSNSGSENSTQTALSQRSKKSNPKKRVFDFYVDDDTGHISWHSKSGPDRRADIFSLFCQALERSEIEVYSALGKAQEMKWVGAVRALKVASQVRKQIADLEREISALRKRRSLEIEVDDWLRRHGISAPAADDFKIMANELKPFFRYREEATSWILKMPDEYLEAHRSLNDERVRIQAKRLGPDEE